MQLPSEPENNDLALLAYFAEQKGWHDIAEQITEQAAELPDEAAEAQWQKFFQVFDDSESAA